MPYIPYKETSLSGTNTRYYVISPAGVVVCTTHAESAAESLAHILNSQGGSSSGMAVEELDWATLNEEPEAAA